mgnify:CR=1 FL=1
MAKRPEIDLTKIAFPSDGLTFGALRRVHPELIDAYESVETGPTLLEEQAGEKLSHMLHSERLLANAAFHISFGGPVHPENVILINEYKKELGETYIAYGIATGRHHADQLIRDIEAQAVEQAGRHGGRRP